MLSMKQTHTSFEADIIAPKSEAAIASTGELNSVADGSGEVPDLVGATN